MVENGKYTFFAYFLIPLTVTSRLVLFRFVSFLIIMNKINSSVYRDPFLRFHSFEFVYVIIINKRWLRDIASHWN